LTGHLSLVAKGLLLSIIFHHPAVYDFWSIWRTGPTSRTHGRGSSGLWEGRQRRRGSLPSIRWKTSSITALLL
jgi:hypothetical protein